MRVRSLPLAVVFPLILQEPVAEPPELGDSRDAERGIAQVFVPPGQHAKFARTTSSLRRA